MRKYFVIIFISILGLFSCERRSVNSHVTSERKVQNNKRIEIVESLNTGLEVFHIVRVDSTEYLFLRKGGAVVIGKIK